MRVPENYMLYAITLWMTRLTVRWSGVQRYDRCVSETEKQKADCVYLVFGPKVLTVVALVRW